MILSKLREAIDKLVDEGRDPKTEQLVFIQAINGVLETAQATEKVLDAAIKHLQPATKGFPAGCLFDHYLSISSLWNPPRSIPQCDKCDWREICEAHAKNLLMSWTIRSWKRDKGGG
jgi:hypothetical protein